MSPLRSFFEILWVAFRLGCTSFGGPIAHLAYFREEYVQRRKWLDDLTYADIVALCQSLPGPASSQVGIAVGMLRGGYAGGIASWIGFTIPSALALAIVATFVQNFDVTDAGWLRGLLIVAVGVVAHAIGGMARSLTPDRPRITIAVLAAVIVLLVPTASVQIVIILLAGLWGWWMFRRVPSDASAAEKTHQPARFSRKSGWIALFAFGFLLVILPLLRGYFPNQELALFDSFYRVGSLVFGGGHVVLPLLATEVVASGWLSEEQFLAGYGLAQAVPGPLFTLSAYLGTAMGGGLYGMIALVGIFLPSFLLVAGALPLWDTIRRHPSIQAALRGVNAGVVGILIAAFYDPIWTKAIQSSADFALALIVYVLLAYWKFPAWLVVLIAVLAGNFI